MPIPRNLEQFVLSDLEQFELFSQEKEPFLLVETTFGEPEPAPALLKMKKVLQVPAVQLVNKPGISRHLSRNGEKILVVSADRWLSSLP